MEDFFGKIISEFSFLKTPRARFWGIFLIIFGFVAESPLRITSHFLANGLLMLLGRDISQAGTIIEKLFNIGASIIFIYIPATVALWIIIRDNLQKSDWIFAPILIGIVLKAGVYGLVSLHYKSNEFWELIQNNVSANLLWAFIFTFIISGIIGFIFWFNEIKKEED